MYLVMRNGWKNLLNCHDDSWIDGFFKYIFMTQIGYFQVSGDSPCIFSTFDNSSFRKQIFISLCIHFFIVSSSYSCSFSALCYNEHCLPAVRASDLLPGREHRLPCKKGHHHARDAGCGHHHLHYHYRESLIHSSPSSLPWPHHPLSHMLILNKVSVHDSTEEGFITHNNTAFCAHELVWHIYDKPNVA